MLLAKGKTVYFNESCKAVDYFKSIGFVTPELSNPSDYFMSIMSIESIEAEKELEGFFDFDKLPEEYQKRIDHFTKSYDESDLKCVPDQILEASEIKPISVEESSYNRTSWCFEFMLLAKRNMLN